jgi:CRISPR/Cas system CSM-associated protein Csm2 small subunit
MTARTTRWTDQRDGTRSAVTARNIATNFETNSLRSTQMYSMYEALARDRMREQRERAAHQRLVNELVSARRWQWLAAYTARRAARSQRRLAERSAADYQLAG